MINKEIIFNANLREKLMIYLLFIFFALVCMSPLASNDTMPAAAEFVFHTSGIQQAKLNLLKGVFPPRVLFYQKDGLHQLPYFQFYSPVLYFTGSLFTLIFDNTWFVFKLTIILALVLAMRYTFKIARRFTKSTALAIICSLVYVSAPYILININIRSAYTEAIGQCLIPVVFYYSLKLFFWKQENIYNFSKLSIAWFLLLGTHLITFAYTALFMGLFFTLIILKDRAFFKKLIFLGAALFYSISLGAWYIIPIIKYTKFLNIHRYVGNPFVSNWLTPLNTLIAPTSIAPSPILAAQILSGNNNLPMPLNPAIGWPILAGFAFCFYTFVMNEPIKTEHKSFLKLFFFLFVLSIFVTCSPIDFWQYLPQPLIICQFTYRILSQSTWIGTCLVGIALLKLFESKKIEPCIFIGIVFFLGLFMSSWLPTLQGKPGGIGFIKTQPSVGYAEGTYLINKRTINNIKIMANSELPINDEIPLYSNNIYDFKNQIIFSKELISRNLDGDIILKANLVCPTNHETNLIFKINNQSIVKSFSPGYFEFRLPFKSFYKEKDLEASYILEIAPQNIESNMDVKLLIDSFTLSMLNFSDYVLNYKEINSNCYDDYGGHTTCKINASKKHTWAQLPIPYYPKMLDVFVNGKSKSYLPIHYRDIILTLVELEKGENSIQVKFVGLKWANWISIISFIILILLLITKYFYFKK